MEDESTKKDKKKKHRNMFNGGAMNNDYGDEYDEEYDEEEDEDY